MMELTCKIHFKDLQPSVQAAIFKLIGVNGHGTNLVEDCGHVVLTEVNIMELKRNLIREEPGDV